jgi:hypothetical protein
MGPAIRLATTGKKRRPGFDRNEAAVTIASLAPKSKRGEKTACDYSHFGSLPLRQGPQAPLGGADRPLRQDPRGPGLALTGSVSRAGIPVWRPLRATAGIPHDSNR